MMKVQYWQLSVLPKLICRYSVIKIQPLFCRYQQTDSTVYMEKQKTNSHHHNIEEEQS